MYEVIKIAKVFIQASLLKIKTLTFNVFLSYY